MSDIPRKPTPVLTILVADASNAAAACAAGVTMPTLWRTVRLELTQEQARELNLKECEDVGQIVLETRDG